MKAGKGVTGWGRLAVQGGVIYLGWRLFRAIRTPDLAGKVVLITGGSRGLGLVLARQFAKEGCRIALCARDDQDLERARIDIAAMGGEVMVQRCDVSDREAVEVLVAAVVKRFGGVDVVVNNAGVMQVGPFDAMTPGDFERAMSVNFWGPLHVIWAALPSLRERKGARIVNITSMGGEIAVPHLLPYDCAKAAFLSLSEGLQVELARHGIKVTTIVPGLMRTGAPLNASFKGNAEKEFAWFSLGDTSILTSMPTERAAQLIVQSARRGDGKVVLTWQAKLLRLAHGVAPNVVLRLLSLVNSFLPGERGLRFVARRGRDLGPPAAAATRQRLEEAARQFNQVQRVEGPPTSHNGAGAGGGRP
jgi:NAD(P)-dependent dehydrogenase (short-subunit alcohol dehydrogenase family)